MIWTPWDSGNDRGVSIPRGTEEECTWISIILCLTRGVTMIQIIVGPEDQYNLRARGGIPWVLVSVVDTPGHRMAIRSALAEQEGVDETLVMNFPRPDRLGRTLAR